MKNGTQNGTSTTARAKKTAPKPVKFTKPTYEATPPHQKRRVTKEEGAAYAQYIQDLRDWLWSLPDKQFDKEILSLTPTEVSSITWLNTYESYQSGGQMREVYESTL
ncbi:MAG: hypothetical protein HOP19_06785 [Acidobacteria bacterium]|nr:hypothetical protein [Acidobacteriota bacterium]